MLPPGKLAAIDDFSRVSIPIDFLRGFSWWKGRPGEVTAELVRSGQVLIFDVEFAARLIASLRSEVSEIEERWASYEAQAVLADRYRQLKLYKDGRLRLTQEVASVLGVPFGERSSVYVQPFDVGLEITSLEFRNARLQFARTIRIRLDHE